MQGERGEPGLPGLQVIPPCSKTLKWTVNRLLGTLVFSVLGIRCNIGIAHYFRWYYMYTTCYILHNSVYLYCTYQRSKGQRNVQTKVSQQSWCHITGRPVLTPLTPDIITLHKLLKQYFIFRALEGSSGRKEARVQRAPKENQWVWQTKERLFVEKQGLFFGIGKHKL